MLAASKAFYKALYTHHLLRYPQQVPEMGTIIRSVLQIHKLGLRESESLPRVCTASSDGGLSGKRALVLYLEMALRVIFSTPVLLSKINHELFISLFLHLLSITTDTHPVCSCLSPHPFVCLRTFNSHRFMFCL